MVYDETGSKETRKGGFVRIGFDARTEVSAARITMIRGGQMTIKEVSDQFEISRDTLRYYEKIGLIGPIGKKANGIRDFVSTDCQRIEFVKCMRKADIPVEVLIQYMRLYDSETDRSEERKALLIHQRDELQMKLDSMNQAMDRLNHKIDLLSTNQLDDYL